jgi:hypothetical protein
MTKKGPLSKAERFYIEGHLDKPMEELCKDLDRAKSTVSKHLKTIAVEDTDKAKTLLYQQFARNGKGATIMTENASTIADDKRAKFTSNGLPERTRKCTTRIIE